MWEMGLTIVPMALRILGKRERENDECDGCAEQSQSDNVQLARYELCAIHNA